MKIKSRFKDYYDGVFYNGQGELFIRETSYGEIAEKHNILSVMSHIESYYNTKNSRLPNSLSLLNRFHYTLLLFCGEMYVIELLGSFNSYERVIDKNKSQILSIAEFNEKDKEEFGTRHHYWGRPTITTLSEDEIEKLHLQFNSPVLLFHFRDKIREVVINPKLSDFYFGRIYDANQAHQKIEMYLANFLFRRDDAIVPVGDDKTRIVSAGFDLKTSFRKEKKK